MPEQTATPIPQDQILAMLQTRGFEAGFQSTPLRDFWGALTSITGEMRQGQRGAFAVSLYNFGDVEVIYSTEPYTNPIAQIEIPVSVKDKSKMGYWGESVDSIINPGIDKTVPHGGPNVKNQDYLIGKKIHIMLTPGHPIPNRDEATGKWEDKPQDCWTLVEIQGEGAAPAVVGQAPAPTKIDTATIALNALNNKTVQQWHQEVFGNPAVKSDVALINQIISGEFISGLEKAGRIVKDANGVYTIEAVA